MVADLEEVNLKLRDTNDEIVVASQNVVGLYPNLDVSKTAASVRKHWKRQRRNFVEQTWTGL